MTLDMEIVRRPALRVAAPPHTAFQASTLEALAAGRWDGDLTVGELRRHGTLGLGTFDGLDGEMIVVDGSVWRARANGTVVAAADDLRTPYATVVSFAADIALAIPEAIDGEEFHEVLRTAGEDLDGPYAVRFDGRLDDIRARSVPRQHRPYMTLDRVAARQQRTFRLAGTLGSLVGFSFPVWAGALQPPGPHLHVITADRRHGGHLFAARVGPGVLRVSALHGVQLELPPGVAPPSGALADPAPDAATRLETPAGGGFEQG